MLGESNEHVRVRELHEILEFMMFYTCPHALTMRDGKRSKCNDAQTKTTARFITSTNPGLHTGQICRGQFESWSKDIFFRFLFLFFVNKLSRNHIVNPCVY